ncbi:MATE family efflux transporter [Haladaptatus caseinilyticus]|uniref:MATE family efflux transporter n=1 Tax=Haladaptatus caseinilyticus TaxID=2993314 RepID=UPI00224A5F8E|nr:MATE family efflux transporter [Haladaptatus caseinilyticus]
MVDVSREEITNGSLTRALLLLAAPLVMQNLVQVAQQVVDTFWLGRLGEDTVAAVGLNFPLLALLFSAVMITNVGTQVLVSQRVGANDESGARRAVFHGVTLALVLGTMLAAFVFVFGVGIISLFGAEASVASMGVVYLTTYSLGFPLIGMCDAIEMGFIGWGDSRAALYINIIAVVVNMILDPFLIFGYGIPDFSGFQVAGAALATILGYAMSLLFALGMTLRGRNGFSITRKSMTFRRTDYREILDIGLPICGQRAAGQSVRLFIIAVVVSAGGSAALAAYTVGARIASVAFIPAGGLSQAAQSIIGQNIGADKPMRARRTTWTGAAIAAIGLTFVGVVQWAAPGALVRIFVPDMTPNGFKLTVEYLKILAYGYWAIGAMYLFNAGFNGARRTKVTMLADLLKYWSVRLPIAAIGVLWFGYTVRAAFWAVTISNIVGAIGAGTYYYYSTSNGMIERAIETASNPAD